MLQSLNHLHSASWPCVLCSREEKKVTSLGILFAMKFIIQAKLPTEECVPPHFHVLSILISDYYAKFTEVIVSLLKGLHLQQKK